MKSDRRHSLAQNDLAKALEKGIKDTKEHSSLITRVILLILVVVLILFAWRQFSSSNRAGLNSDIMFLTSNGPSLSQEVIDSYLTKYPSGNANAHFNMLIGELEMTKVAPLLASNRPKAVEGVTKALDSFKAADARKSSEPKVAEATVWGLGQAYETLAALQGGENYDEAIAAYERIVKTWPKGEFVKLAQERLDLLKRPLSQTFLADYAKSDIGTPAPAPLQPGEGGTTMNITMPEEGTAPEMSQIFNPGLESTTPETATPEATSESTPAPAEEPKSE